MDPDESSGQGEHRHTTNPSQLFSSAKVVADATKSALQNDTDKLDKGAVAGAAADLLGAASHYGKLEEGKFGEYVEKAETYLHQYSSPPSAAAAAAPTDDADAATDDSSATGEAAGHAASTHSVGAESEGGGGLGDYMKIAQGFFK